jgi:hypothetical protein
MFQAEHSCHSRVKQRTGGGAGRLQKIWYIDLEGGQLMSRKRVALFVGVCGLLAISGTAFAESCTLFADNGGEVWLRVYQEDNHGGKGQLIFDGHLAKEEKRTINTPNGRIRYDYKNAPNDGYHGNVGAWCQHNDTVRVP